MLVGQQLSVESFPTRRSSDLQLAALPQPSVAVHVRRIVPLPVQLVPPKASRKVMLVTPLQVSVAVATPVLLVRSEARRVGMVLIVQGISGEREGLRCMVETHVAGLTESSFC